MSHVIEFGPRTAAATLRQLLARSTPGPWDAFNGHVSSVGIPPSQPADAYTRSDEASHEYYGGELVCESCTHADAVLIAAMRTLVPALIDALAGHDEQMRDLRKQLHHAWDDRDELAKDLADARHLIELIRSERYRRPLNTAIYIAPRYTTQGGGA